MRACVSSAIFLMNSLLRPIIHPTFCAGTNIRKTLLPGHAGHFFSPPPPSPPVPPTGAATSGGGAPAAACATGSPFATSCPLFSSCSTFSITWSWSCYSSLSLFFY
ncbi:hypothetical protein AAHE18_20G174300 [Arachis hypogaea]